MGGDTVSAIWIRVHRNDWASGAAVNVYAHVSGVFLMPLVGQAEKPKTEVHTSTANLPGLFAI
jgi:hypothetical protein